MSNEELGTAALLLLLASQHEISRLHAEVAQLERIVAHWEAEAVLRAVTVANDLILRTREAELDAAHIRTSLSELAQKDLSIEALRARLIALTHDP